MTELKHIPLNKILVNPEGLRQVDENNPAFLELVESVGSIVDPATGRMRGVLQSILVREIKKDNETFYGLIDGLQRFTAATRAGLETIPAQITEMDDAESMEAQIITNAVKVETKPAEFAQHINRLLNMNPTMTISELAGKLNKSPEWLTKIVGLVKLEAAVAKLVDDGTIKLTNAIALSRLPKEEQVAQIEAAISLPPDQFLPKMAERIKEIREAKRTGRNPEEQKFTPVAYMRKIGEVKSEQANPVVGPALIQKMGVSDPVAVWKLAMDWALNLDPVSVEIARNKYETAQKASAEKKAQAKAERAKKAAEAAAKAADDAAKEAEAAKK